MAIALHWLTAALIIATLLLAWRFEQLVGPERGALIRIHKSIGVTIFVLTLARVAWRLTHRPSPAPPGRAWRLAGLTHGLFYALLIVLPLSGWAMISLVEPLRRTWIWELFVLPPVPGLPQLDEDAKYAAHDAFGAVHLTLGLVMVALLVVHVAAAIWHGARRETGGVATILAPRRRG